MGSSSWSWLASLGVESLPYSELGWVIRPQCSQLAVPRVGVACGEGDLVLSAMPAWNRLPVTWS